MASTIVETRAVTGGVDTHADVHVAAALDPVGGLLGIGSSRPRRLATRVCPAGCAASGRSAWCERLVGHGPIRRDQVYNGGCRARHQRAGRHKVAANRSGYAVAGTERIGACPVGLAGADLAGDGRFTRSADPLD